FFYYVPVLMLHTWSVVAPVSEHVVLLVLRLFCALSGIGCLWFMYRIGLEVFGRKVALVAVFLFLVLPTFLRWTVESHPDLPQLFWILFSVLFALRYTNKFGYRNVCLAAIGAGLAFGTKFGGVFLLPTLYVALFIPLDLSNPWVHLKDLRRWVGGGIIVLGFCGAFIVSNPFALIYFPDFVQSLMAEKAIMTFGHRVQATSGAEAWVMILIQSVGIFSLVILVGVFGYRILQRQLLIRADCLVIGIWILSFLAYLMLEANLKRPRHLLPILPFVLLFVGWAYIQIWHWAVRAYRYFTWLKWVGLIGVMVSAAPLMRQSIDLFIQKYNRENDRVEIHVGRWVSAHFSEETSMVFDAYAYVPSKFQNVYRTFGQNYQMINHFEPDLLLVRDAIRADFGNPNEANDARMGAQAYMDCHYFYSFLGKGFVPDYRILKDFGSVAIYERIRPKVRDEEKFKDHWRRLVLGERDHQRYGQVEALWTLGWMHHLDGNDVLASQTWSRLVSLNNYVKRLYSHGVRLLQTQEFEGALRAFEIAMKGAQDESIAFQAGMREDLGYRFLKIRRYDDAIKVAEEALSLTDNLPAAAFERAVGYIAVGQEVYGTKLFEEAIEKFGAQEKGLQLLEQLMLMEVEVQAMQNLQIRFYTGSP
ncbi:MAG: hypothetical protein HOE48_17305, partial [Candidatus Latescibacteria bacterium]|nr:hypothetical protein [Candidatus Latescibacterota bacterium]